MIVLIEIFLLISFPYLLFLVIGDRNIPVEVITREEAVKLGLTNNETNNDTGNGVAAAGCMVRGKIDKSEPEIVLEKTVIRTDGKKEITFMHEDRKKQLMKDKKFEDYINQFEKIEGKEKADFLKEHNLRLIGQET